MTFFDALQTLGALKIQKYVPARCIPTTTEDIFVAHNVTYHTAEMYFAASYVNAQCILQ